MAYLEGVGCGFMMAGLITKKHFNIVSKDTPLLSFFRLLTKSIIATQI